MVHDNDLSRLCAIGRLTQEYEYNKLPKMAQFPINIPFVMDKNTGQNKLYERKKKGDTQKINNIEELLKELAKVDKNSQVWLNIEFKDDDEQTFKEVHRLLKLYKRDHLTIWSHIDDEQAIKLTQIDPKIRR